MHEALRRKEHTNRYCSMAESAMRQLAGNGVELAIHCICGQVTVKDMSGVA